MVRTISCDIETYSPVNLSKTGVYPYAAHPDFQILLFGYAIDDEPVQVVDLASGEKLPGEILAALVDPQVIKWAFNASFERVCLSAWLQRHHPELLSESAFLDPGQWRCSMIWSAYLGMPMSLDQVAKVLDLPVKKDAAGKKLIKQFQQATARFDQISAEISGRQGKLAAMRHYLKTLQDLSEKPVLEFSERIWHVLTDHAIIYPDGKIEFIFKDGTRIKEKIG